MEASQQGVAKKKTSEKRQASQGEESGVDWASTTIRNGNAMTWPPLQMAGRESDKKPLSRPCNPRSRRLSRARKAAASLRGVLRLFGQQPGEIRRQLARRLLAPCLRVIGRDDSRGGMTAHAALGRH